MSASTTVAPFPAALLALLTTGFAFGFLFERSHVYEPSSIREQFLFRNFLMLKMFMAAVCAACLSFAFWDWCDPWLLHGTVRRERNCLKRLPCGTVLFGGALLGAGMVVSGACPGMVLPQVGAQVHNCWWTLAGGFAGALAHNLVLAVCAKLGLPGLGATAQESAAPSGKDRSMLEAEYLDLRYGLPFRACMFSLASVCALGALGLELVAPYKEELLDYSGGRWHASAWPPQLCGFGIGAVNLVSLYAAHDSMGSATAYAQLAGQALVARQGAPARVALLDAEPRAPRSAGDAASAARYFESRSLPDASSTAASRMLRTHWQIPYLAASVIGAYASAKMADNVPSGTPGIPDARVAFLGGVLMLLGSRLGGGCTSGHGIAGMPLLNLKSILGVCSMFGAGIAVAVGMHQAGVLLLRGSAF